MHALYSLILIAVLAVVVAGKKKKNKCNPGFELKNGQCKHKNQAYYNCPAGTYAQGSNKACDDFELVFGSDSMPSDTKSRKHWWKRNGQQLTCSKTHNLMGSYCKTGKGGVKNWNDAKDICEKNNGRLCTLTELEDGDTSGTGCNFNKKRVWSSTPCGNNMFWTTSGAPGHEATIGGKKCLANHERKGRVRCCADDRPNLPVCLPCPRHTTSNAGAAGEHQCSCTSGSNGVLGCTEVIPWNVKTCGAGDYRKGSLADCAELTQEKDFSMTSLTNSNGKGVCASDTSAEGDCPGMVTHSKAEEICADQGARLCTADEITSTGAMTDIDSCNSLGKRMFTSTKCAANKYVIASNVQGGQKTCGEAEETARVMCCGEQKSQNNFGGQYCENCPSNSNSVSGSSSVYDCKPSTHFKPVYPWSANNSPSGEGSEVYFEDAGTECEKGYYLENSEARCEDLDWNNKNQGKNKNVCSSSIVDGECSGAVAFATAKDFCEDVGARLCTFKELDDNEAKDSGCDIDARRVWSSTPCIMEDNNQGRVKGDEGIMTAPGKKNGGKKIDVRCDNPESNEKYRVRCCADVEPKCTKCPAHATTSGKGSIGKDSCFCKAGYNGADGGLCEPPTKSPTPPPTKRQRAKPTECLNEQYMAGSEWSCAALQLQPSQDGVLRNEMGKKPCGTLMDGANCIFNGAKKTFVQAKQHCENRHMRLCTGMELIYSIPLNHAASSPCWGSAPNVNAQKHFWSLKPCFENPKWTGNPNANRDIHYHVVAVPYYGTMDRQGVGFNKPGEFPNTQRDLCESGKQGSNAKHHVACCADVNAQYCHTCPQNSMRTYKNDWPARTDRKANTDCPCDKWDYNAFGQPVGAAQNYNYDVSGFRVCLPYAVTQAPTKYPTASPTNNPTVPPGEDVCPEDQFWNGVNPNKNGVRNWGAGKGSYACNPRVMNNKVKWGPGWWAPRFHGCNGRCREDFGVDPASECREDLRLPWTNQKICVNTNIKGFRFFEEHRGETGNSYKNQNCNGDQDCCSKRLNWGDARKFCESMGARLCTTFETDNSCPERTGCDYDYTWVWTANPCTIPSTYAASLNPGGMGHVAAPGDHRKWERKMDGDCKFKLASQADEEGHKACLPSSDAQGMPNDGDSIPDTSQILTGMTKQEGDPVTEDWIKPQTATRYLYRHAMMDLFGWNKNSADLDDPSTWPADRPNPMLDADFGKVCLPDNYKVATSQSIEGVFVRCCADYGPTCLNCPQTQGGVQFTSPAQMIKDFYACTLTCPAGTALDEFGECV